MNSYEKIYNLLTETEESDLKKKHAMYAKLVKLGLAGTTRMHREKGKPMRVRAVRTPEGWLRKI